MNSELFQRVLNEPIGEIKTEPLSLANGWDSRINVRIASARGRSKFIPTGIKGIDSVIALTDTTHWLVESPETAPDEDGRDASIVLPYPEAFLSPSLYRRTVVHELSHLSGFKWQTRKMPTTLAMLMYPELRPIEEMVAELTSFIYCDVLDCVDDDTRHYQLEYVRVWMERAFNKDVEGQQRAFDKAYAMAMDAVNKFQSLAS